MEDIVVRGEKIEDISKKMEWEVDYNDHFKKADISGVTVQKPGESICTGCVTGLECIIMIFCADNAGACLDQIEICCGPDVKALKESKKSIISAR